ncbi:MAG: translation elongation factor 4 [Candidatus Wildermuthbacteria bacterium]|nr:translation elongation factor 4 [Candidatus Wildermuthbacteria bacterium]
MEQSKDNFIRNFCVISHVDHGKSTLADRFLELTGTIQPAKMMPQYLDSMDLERGKGITIKMHPVRMEYKEYILNLIDTPGHVDFSYEVSRSLAAVEGAILLVDATQGIQAQTLANLELAKRQKLVIIPAINKIDSPQAKIKETKEELSGLLNVVESEIFEISGKYGTNVEKLLEAVIEKVPPPSGDSQKPLRALIFDSKYDPYQGVIAYVRIVDGRVKPTEKIYLLQAEVEGEVKETGFFKPELKPSAELVAGEAGYIATGIKEPGQVRVGDTITKITNSKLQITNVEPLPGYKEPRPMVFASIYPENPDDFELLKVALAKLKLNDAAFTFEADTKEALGRGYQCGFLGTLHAEIITERLRREFGLSLVISSPQVLYKIVNQAGKELFIYSPSDWPEQGQVKEALEPWVGLEIITPLNYLGPISEILKALETNFVKTEYFGKDKVILFYEAPLRKIIVGFYDNLKGASQGFASMNYEVLGYRQSDLVKLEILIAGKKEEVFSKIVEREDAGKEGQKITLKLKEVIPSQLFAVSIQAVISGKIIARETISAKRRDVIAPLYGGDYTRKKKLLEKQKKGKEKLKGRADIRIPPEVFLKIFKS